MNTSVFYNGGSKMLLELPYWAEAANKTLYCNPLQLPLSMCFPYYKLNFARTEQCSPRLFGSITHTISIKL